MIGKQTTLDLNGPILSFIQQPQSVGVCDSGSTTFIGIATAFFPTQDPPNPASNTGILSYRWYAVGFGALTDGTFQGATISGTTSTTLTVSNAKSPTANGLRLFVGVDYVPSAYSQPMGSAVTVGTGRSTGNAVNEVLDSDTATLTVFPKILITTQPQNITVDDETTATFSVTAQSTDIPQGTLSYQWLLNGQELTNSSTVSGATTPNLSIQYLFRGVYSIQVRIIYPASCDSPLLSNEAVFGVVAPSQMVTVETMTSSSSIASIESYSLDLAANNQLTLLAQNYTNSTSLISLFAPGRNITVEMEMYSGKGNNSGSYSGGAGGYSKIKFTMNKNEEYVISGLNSINNNPFVYRKSSLIAVCGRGGDAATGGRGGNGGGIGISGENGNGPSSGTGGQRILSGTLSSIGIFGSSSTASPRSPDTKAAIPIGGRTIPCSKGDYWTSRGFSSCQDVGISKFFYGSTEITNTSAINRGFKQGYDVRQTAGSGVAPTTGTRFVSRTCTRTVPRTSTRNISSSVTKTTTFTHDNSITASGDSMLASISGSGYNVNVSGLGLNSTNYSVSIHNISQITASGQSRSISLASGPSISGFNFYLEFNSIVQRTSFRTIPRTSFRTVQQTCTRTIPRTSFRTASRSVTKVTSFNHVFDNRPGVFQTTSFTSSGDPMSATINGEGGGTRSYSINVSGLGLNSTNYSVNVDNSSQAAAGDFPGISVNVLSTSGFTVYLEFRNNTLGSSTFARDFTVRVFGAESFQEAYDDSYTESYDCSYTEAYDDSFTEAYDDSYTEASFIRSFTATVTGTADFQESFDDSFTESFDCSYNETFTISGGGNGGSGATGGNGGGSGGGGGGGSGYTDGSVQVLESTSGGNNDNARIVLRAVDF